MVMRTIELDHDAAIGNDDVGVHGTSPGDWYALVIVNDGTSDRLQFMGKSDLLL
ncbi:hypothetical protein MHOL44478_21070 [Mycobacterium holsaticum DSM 44478]|nr:hypothetical protein [Mycolicibacterium holsaticum DSM 44478 = JCM 12374]